MMARSLCILMLFAMGSAGGCCTTACGPCGQPMNCLCLPCWPRPIVWDGCSNECGPCPGESCDEYCCSRGACGPLGHGGLFPWLRGTWSCGRGCGEVYCDEWVSDPPDCCDPCDQCHGVFTGHGGGYCCLGPCQRLLAALHGYKYCPAPQCGPWRPIFGHCGRGYGACGCGDLGCAGCGGGAPHGADVYYNGPIETKAAPHIEGGHILQENWNIPKPAPQPGKPIHNARQPQPEQLGQAPVTRSAVQSAARQNPAGIRVRRASF